MDQLHSSATGPATPNAPTLDVEDIIQDYLGEGLSAKENANMSHLSPAGLLLVLGEAGLKRDYLYKLRLAGHTALADWHELGMVHIHDLGLGVKTPYCSGHSLENLLHEGISAGNIISGPAKRLRSAVNHIINHIGACSNEFAGAQAFNDIDLFLGPYALDFFISRVRTFNMDAEMAMKMTMEEVDQSMQELIFHLNYNTRYGGQSPFSNVTLSLTIPDDMRDRRPLVGGQTLEDRWGADTFTASCAGDHVTYGDLAMWQNIVGEAILNNFMRGDSKGTGFTFPVLTISVTEEFFQHPLKKKVFELSAKFGNPYFQNYINGYSGGEKLNPSDVRSMCPLAGSTLLPLRAGRGVFIQKIAVAYDAQERVGASYEALHNGAWEKARVVRVDDCAATVTIKLANGIQVVMDDRHEQPARVSKNSSTEVFKGGELNEGMYLPVAATGIADEYDNYIAGYVAGAYVGDGSVIKGGVDECCKSLIFSLSTSGKKVHARSIIENFFAAQGYKVSITEKEDVALVSLRIGCSGDAAERWVRQFVEGDTAQEKKLTQRVFQLGGAFLRGLLDGWMATDGGNRGRIYTASETLAEQFCHVCGMLGVHYNMRIDKPDTRDGRLGTNPVYTCKVHTRDCYGNVFFFADGYYWFPIESVSMKREDGLKTMYCLAVDSDEHLFQLANGLVTHNCRLSINEKEIRKHVGGLFGNADQTGSLQVVTLNLPMLAMTARQISGADVAARYSNFVNIIDAVMEKVKAEQLWKREIVERSFDEGFFSMAKANFKRGFKTFFTTVGFVGLWEAIEAITGDEDSFLKEENLQMAVDVLNHMRGVTDRWTEETGKLFNLEATPAESAAHKLAIKMLKTFPDAPHRGTAEAPYLTNSCHIPVELQNRVDLLMQTQSRLQPLLSGGTVLHLHVGEELDSDGVEAMVRAMCGSPIPYFSVSPVYTKCDCCGRIIPGTHEYCPHEHTDEQVEALRRRRPDLIEE